MKAHKMIKSWLGTLLVLLTGCQSVDGALLAIAGLPSSDLPAANTVSAPMSYPDLHAVPFSARGDATYLQRWNGQAYENFYVKGVNLGVGLPGTSAGELAASREQYQRWFKRMGEIGVNSLRIFTLHYPHFYEELGKYNAAHPERPIYLFHGVWLDEGEPGADLYPSGAGFGQNLREAVDAVHGRLEVGQRAGRAWGDYNADISRWVAGWILGREIGPAEILTTNRQHADQTTYEGKHLQLPQGNPTEVWLARQIDALIAYERGSYGVERPISCWSAPGIGPRLAHTEASQASIDLSQLNYVDAPAGYFASFHADPSAPSVITDVPAYRAARDSEGVNNYLGYLKDLKAHYSEFPLVIAGYGAPSSWGNTSASPSGIDRGGYDEQRQGQYDARLTRNLREAGTGGGMLASWIDEWWKRAAIVDELAFPHDRYRLWNNLTSPEANLGLIAFEFGEPAWHTIRVDADGPVQRIEAAADAKYFHLRLSLDQPVAEPLVIGYDTYAADLGDPVLPGGLRSRHRHEFALEIDGGSAHLRVTRPYDLFGISRQNNAAEPLYRSLPLDGGPWLPVRWLNAQPRGPEFSSKAFEIGNLRVRSAGAPASSLDAVTLGDRRIEVRIPWTLLNFTDPSTRSVMHDDKSTPLRESRISDGIAVSVGYRGQVIDSASRYAWAPWQSVAPTVEREKPALRAMQQVWQTMPDSP